MDRRLSPLLVSMLCIGIAILYIPILVLIGYSFNASALAGPDNMTETPRMRPARRGKDNSGKEILDMAPGSHGSLSVSSLREPL